MKTMKQIADTLGVSKQQVYRYIKKKRINEASREAGVLYYDGSAEALIKRHFEKKTASSEALRDTREVHHDAHREVLHDTAKAHREAANDTDEALHDAVNEAANDTVYDSLINMLQRELEVKNNQIEALNEALLNAQRQAEAAQVLHAADIRMITSNENNSEVDTARKSFWKRIIGR